MNITQDSNGSFQSAAKLVLVILLSYHFVHAPAMAQSNPQSPAKPTAVSDSKGLHALEALLAAGDQTRPIKPYDIIDWDAARAFGKSLSSQSGKTVTFTFTPTRGPIRSAQNKFRWDTSDRITAGAYSFGPTISLTITPELEDIAASLVPGHTATVTGVFESFDIYSITADAAYACTFRFRAYVLRIDDSKTVSHDPSPSVNNLVPHDHPKPTFKVGDIVRLNRPTLLYFKDQIFGSGTEGDSFVVLAYKPDEKKVFLGGKDGNGKDIALSVAEDSLILIPQASTSLDTSSQDGLMPENTQNKTPAQKTLVLAKNWDTQMQGGTSTMEDLAKLFGKLTKANVNLNGDDSIKVYQDVAYLTPIRAALATLKLHSVASSKVLVACPGFPRDSLYYYAIDGRFDEGFNRMYLVADMADQLVSVELVNEAPPKRNASTQGPEWHTYNFVCARVKGSPELSIVHQITLSPTKSFAGTPYTPPGTYIPQINSTNQNWQLATVDSLLLQPAVWSRIQILRSGEPKEQVRWFVPRPIVEIILSCIQTPTK